MKKVITTAVAAIAVLVLAGQASAISIKEGAWDMTTVIKPEGMDADMAQAQKEMDSMDPAERAMMEKMMGGMGMKMGMQGGGMSISMTQCITNGNPVPKAKDEDDNCEQTHTIKGNTVHFETVCPKSTSTGEIVYKNDTMKGNIKTVTTPKKGKQEITHIDISGKYKGPCDGTETINLGEMSEDEFAKKQKALDLKKQELEIRKQEMELEDASSAKKPAPNSKSPTSTINDVNNAVNTTNNVKNAFNGLRSLMGN